MSREQNFISAVVYLGRNSNNPVNFIGQLLDCFDSHFMHYEIIAVNNGADDETLSELRGLKSQQGTSAHISIITMSLRQSREQCMNAGLDLSAGDYVYEFDTDEGGYDFSLIWTAYQSAIQGSDIVTVCPKRENAMSRIFYSIFNSYSSSAYPLRTNAFTLISRRALNRAHTDSASPAYRKAVYASIGLKMTEIEYDGRISAKEEDRFRLAADSLVLYTDFGYKFSLRFAALMMMITLAGLIFTVAVWLGGNPVSGWTTTMFVLTLGLSGMFGVSAIILKYLALIMRFSAKRQDYLIEGIEKI